MDRNAEIPEEDNNTKTFHKEEVWQPRARIRRGLRGEYDSSRDLARGGGGIRDDRVRCALPPPAPTEEEADDQSSSNENEDHGIMIVVVIVINSRDLFKQLVCS